jgi:DNA-binding response OmpR family regulator
MNPSDMIPDASGDPAAGRHVQISSPKRLLLIDDELSVTEFVQQVAEDQAFEVHSANRSATFKSSYEAFRPTGIILDLAMPGIDGIEFLRWLARQDCKARIVILSGSDPRVLDAADRLGKARGLNMIGVLSKPIRLAALRVALMRLSEY